MLYKIIHKKIKQSWKVFINVFKFGIINWVDIIIYFRFYNDPKILPLPIMNVEYYNIQFGLVVNPSGSKFEK